MSLILFFYFAVKHGEVSIRHKVVMAITSTPLWLLRSSLLYSFSLFLTEPPGNRCPVQSAVCQGLQLIVEIFFFFFFFHNLDEQEKGCVYWN